MNLLLVCADPGIPLDGVKGASVHVRQTIGALAAREVAVTVAALRPGEPHGIPARVVPVARRERPDGAGRGVEREARSLAAAVRLADAALAAGERFDLVYERYSLWSLAGVAVASRLGVPLAVEVNAPLVEEQARFRGLELAGLAREIERAVVTRADVVLCVSRPLVARAVGLRGDASGVHWTPNAVDTERFVPARFPRRAHPPTVGFVGSLKPWHGLDVLLDAMARLAAGGSAARLLIVGDGPERARLEDRARRSGIEDRVRFTGPVDHETVPGLLHEIDVAVAPYPPSDDFYFSPLKLGEYLAAGVATVCSDLPGIAEGLTDGESVVLVPPGDPAALAEAVADLIADPVRRRRIGTSARRAAVERFSLAASADRLVSLLRDAIAHRAAHAAAGGTP